MDRQMERGLFGNDHRAQSGSKGIGTERPMDTDNLQLADKPRKTNEAKRASVTIEGLRAILIRQEYRCALSGVVLSPDCASLDHITPLSKGGKHELSNLQILHPVVNGLKGQMNQNEFMRWVKLIASGGSDDFDQAW